MTHKGAGGQHAFVLKPYPLKPQTLTSHTSHRGAGGRHAFIFMRYVNTWGYLGLQVFCGLPFIYELRAVLDWSCTPTTLKLFDWLKLEDISTSLYFVTCDRYGREGRHLGDRQPRYMKFCQVGSFLLALLSYAEVIPVVKPVCCSDMAE